MKLSKTRSLVLSAIVLVAVAVPPIAHAFEVSGAFFYEDRLYNGHGFTGTVQNLPIRHATVEIVDAATTLPLATGYTGTDGSFAIEVDGQTLPVSFYARCLTDGGDIYYITVVDAPQRDLMGGWVPPNPPIHAITSDTVLLHDPMLDYDLGSYLVQDTDGTGVAQAFNIFDNVVDFFDWVALPGNLGHLPEAENYVSLSWGPLNPNTGSNYTINTIMLSSPGTGSDTDGWADTVILHETGHWFDDNYSRSDNPGGAHFLGDNDANVLLAYGEGAATYHCAKVREFRALSRGIDNLVSLYADLTIPPPVGTPGGLSFSYDFETGVFGNTGAPIGQIGSANETNVTSALWDLLDGPGTPDATPGFDDDPVEVADSYAWAIEVDYLPSVPPSNPITVEDYWQGWFALNGPGFMQSGLETIFVTLARMPFLEDGFEDDGTPALAGSIVPMAHVVSPGGGVVINEIELGPLDAVELYNAGESAADLTGWQIEVYQNDIAPGDPPTIYTFTGGTLLPGETITLHEAGSPLDNGPYHVYAGDQQTFNAPWNTGIDGAVEVRDNLGTPLDFVKWRAADGTENSTPVPAGLTFTGLLNTPPAPQTLARDISGTDTDSASDFSGHYGSLGSVNHPAPQYHTLFDVGDQDVIAFDAVAGTRYGFETKGPFSKSDPRIELLSSSGATLGSNDDIQGSVRDARLDFYASESGTFYVRVTHVGTQTDYAEYQLLAFERPPSEALIAPGGLSAEAANHTHISDPVTLQWVNASAYDAVRVYRDGSMLAELPGSASSYLDSADRGFYQYGVSGVLGGSETAQAVAYEYAGPVVCYSADDFESGTAGLWIHEESAPASSWDVTPFAQTGAWAFTDSPLGVPYRGCPAGESGCTVNAIAEFGVPAILQPGATLEWDHICITEAEYDYGIVEITDDDGITWVEIARYDQTHDPGWEDNVADPTDWRHESLDLSDFAGSEVRIRFRLESDTNLEFEGWFVDNLLLGTGTGCVAADVEDFVAAGVLQMFPPRPNPIHGNASVLYVLPENQDRVDLILYDVAGRVVRYERFGAQPLGPHAWTWDGTNREGAPVASGVYFARLQAGKESVSIKMMKLD